MKKEKGQSLIEFAFIIPILFFFILIASDIGRWVNVHYSLQELASEILRVYVMRYEYTEESYLKQEASFRDIEKTVKKMIDHNAVLASEKIHYDVEMSEPYRRYFNRKEYQNKHKNKKERCSCRGRYDYYDDRTGVCYCRSVIFYDELYEVDNYNEVSDIRVKLQYHVDNSDFVFFDLSSLGNMIEKEYSGIIFLRSDGHD